MKHLLCILLLAGTLVSQAQTPNELFKHIPADADHVYLFNVGAIAPKLDLMSIIAHLKQYPPKNPKTLGFGDFDILMNSGIDLHQDILLAVSNAFDPDSSKYTTIIAHLTDSAKFSKAVRNGVKNQRTIHVPGAGPLVADSGGIYAWNDRLAIILMTKVPHGQPLSVQSQNRIARRTIAALRGFNNTIFTTDNHFLASFKEEADIHIWNRHSQGFGAMNKMLMGNKPKPMSGLAHLASKANADPTIGTVWFEPGKIVYRSLRLLTPAGKEALQRLTGQGQGWSKELVAAVPPGKIMALVTAHFDMAAWADSMSRGPMAGMFNSQLQKEGLTTQDIAKALHGDFLALMYNPEKPAAGGKPMPTIYLAATVGDKATFARICKVLKFSDAAVPDDPSAVDSTHHRMLSYYGVQGNLAVIGGSRESVNTFFNHPPATSSPTDRLLTDKVNSNSFTAGLDMHAAADFLTPVFTRGDTTDPKGQAILNVLRQMDVLRYAAGSIHDDVMESAVELRMTDPNKNALSTLVDIILGFRAAESHEGLH